MIVYYKIGRGGRFWRSPLFIYLKIIYLKTREDAHGVRLLLYLTLWGACGASLLTLWRLGIEVSCWLLGRDGFYRSSKDRHLVVVDHVDRFLFT